MLSSVTGTAVAAKDRLMITRLTPNNNQPVDGTQLHEIQDIIFNLCFIIISLTMNSLLMKV